jgi:hypothetical protein
LTVEVKRGLDVTSGTGRQLVAGDGSARLRFRSLSGDLEFNTHGARDTSQHSASEPAQDEPETADALDVLRALERGEIDVDEASRRLEGAPGRG